MNLTEQENRPVKKRRFFEEDLPPSAASLPSSTPDPPLPSHNLDNESSRDIESHIDFDKASLDAIVGEELPQATVVTLRQLSNNNLERAINIYLDGSWASIKSGNKSSLQLSPSRPLSSRPPPLSKSRSFTTDITKTIHCRPEKRYLGAFGVTGWATTSGVGLLRYGETIKIERAKPTVIQQTFGNQSRQFHTKRQDTVVRFTNGKGQEVGRLENDSCEWISALLDEDVCFFKGTVVFAPERIRTNDNIYLQLHCYLLVTAFDRSKASSLESNRRTGPFETQESLGERALRLRQIALIKLLEEINLKPTKSNEQVEKTKRDALVSAAEKDEQRQLDRKNNPNHQSADTDLASSSNEEVEEGEEVQQDQLDALYKKAQTFDFNTPEATPPDSFALELRKYQKQALYWMLQKETNQKLSREQSIHPLWDEYLWPIKDVDDQDLPSYEGQSYFYINSYSGELSLEFPVQEQNCLGGILADEMGLGKTIEMLSLIHSRRHPVETSQKDDISTINDLTRPISNPISSVWAPATTLVVGPMSLIAQWQGEVERASKPGSIKTLVYYGNEKGTVDLRSLCCEANASQAPNVIITSYGTILSEFTQMSKQGLFTSVRGLFALEYFRVILDEAHFIKNRQSKTSKACFEIKAKHRWVLTGTPIVNRLEDLFSLVHFLKVEPWSNFSYWKTFITVPFEAKNFIRALDVVQTVLEPLVMRRTKDMKTPNGEALVPLPPRTISVEKIKLSKNEKEIYNLIFARARRTFQQNEEAGTLLKSYSTIFAQILRLRQACCHPLLTRNQNLVDEENHATNVTDLAKGLADDMDLDTLLQKFIIEDEKDANSFGANAIKAIQDQSNIECPICTEEPMNQQVVTACWHSACKQCLMDYVESQLNRGLSPKCFNCRGTIDPKDIFEVIHHDAIIDVSPIKPRVKGPRISLRRVGCDGSSKISALVKHILQLRREDPLAKTVVFSQFTSFLDLIEKAFQRDQIKYLRFDGSMAQKHRADVINHFVTRKSGTVLLLSLRAGGVGLNLTAAKRVYMMDPWWSFAIEAQAIDRVHRMGQDSEVTVTRFIVEESIEEKMLRIQDRKKFIATSLGMMTDEEKKVQRIEDIKELLS